MEDWKKVKLKQARVFADNLKLSIQALDLLERYTVTEAYIVALIKHQLWFDALSYLAYVLPVREGVWWACLAARDSLKELQKSSQDCVAIEAAEQWVYHPNLENRTYAMKVSRLFEKPSQVQLIVMAIDLSGHSPSPDLEVACSSLIAGAINISALQGNESKDDRYNCYLTQGIDIAKGGNGKITGSQ